MQFHYMQIAWGLRKWMKITKELEMVMCHGLPHMVSIPNGRTSLWWTYSVWIGTYLLVGQQVYVPLNLI
jgi:hypothetical protein